VFAAAFEGSSGSGAAAGASLRPKGILPIAGLSTGLRTRTMRVLGAMADGGGGATAGADVSPDAGGSASAVVRGVAVPASGGALAASTDAGLSG
jgi:hypothetical protein